MKRVISVILVITAFSTPAFAKYSGGSGAPNNPYQIANVADLMTLANDTNDYNKCFIQIADINLTGQVFTAAIIAPDGNFTGTFDGGNHVITNFTINGDSKLGFFGVNYGSIKNLGLENFIIRSSPGAYNVGGLAGVNESTGHINNCHSSGNVRVRSNSQQIGGVAGTNIGVVTGSFSTGTVSGDARSFYLGGLVGNNFWGTISKCSSTADINGGSSTGGLAGSSIGIIKDSFSTGTIIVGPNSSGAGGIAGELSNRGSINNCFSTSKITGENGVFALGGLVGISMSGAAYINNCFSTGSVTGGANSFCVGGFIGKLNFGNISYCYSTGDVNGASGVGGFAGGGEGLISSSYFLDVAGPNNGYGTPLTDSQMKHQASFAGWDFVWETANGHNDAWAICEGNSYPKLTWQFIPGDFDNNKDVNFIDFSILAGKWMQADSTLYCGGTDLTGDSLVDWNDLTAFTENWLVGL